MEIDDEKIQELIAGYSVGALDEAEKAQAEELLRTSVEARQLLAEFEEVTAGLALSVDPVELPAGSLDRLRLKAEIETTSGPAQAPVQPTRPTIQPLAEPTPFQPRAGRKAFWTTSTIGSLAAALVLLVIAAVFGVMWLNTNSQLDQLEKNRQALTQILAAPDLKTTELKATGTTTDGNVRLYADPTTNKVYLVASNMTALSGDKEYEAWLIGGDNNPKPAGLLGSGGSNGNTAIFELNTTVPVDQVKVVAVTVEKKGGSQTPTQPLVMAGNIPA